MRVSADEDDAGYASYEALMLRGRALIVMVDGFIVSNVHTADEEEGFALCYKRNADGELYCEPGDLKPASETLRGKVEIVVHGSRLN